jgi:hypothetical protein
MAEERSIIVRQQEGERFALDHAGQVALHGREDKPALQHQFGGQVVHTTVQPLVHMICWEEDQSCGVEVSGSIKLTGDEKAPVEVRMSHRFENDHHQTLQVEPLDHTLNVRTKLAEPIHHALQLRTPVEMRFCNPWHIASDYLVEINAGKRQLFAIRLTGATVARPQPCDGQDPCPPDYAPPGTP